VHEQKQRLDLHDEHDALVDLIVAEVLMDSP